MRPSACAGWPARRGRACGRSPGSRRACPCSVRARPTPLVVPVLTRPTSVDVVLHPQTELPRQLVVTEQAAPGWRGALAGQPLELVADDAGMLRAPIGATGPLVVDHRSRWPYLASVQLLLMAALVVVALPKHRPVDPDAEELL